MDDLDEWLRQDFPTAYRTACLLLGDPDAAQEAAQDAFTRTWRFRAALPRQDRRAWLYRALLTACARGLAEPLADGAPGGALAGLPDRLLVPLVLRWHAGLSEREVATATSTRTGTVRNQLREAAERLAGGATERAVR